MGFAERSADLNGLFSRCGGERPSRRGFGTRARKRPQGRQLIRAFASRVEGRCRRHVDIRFIQGRAAITFGGEYIREAVDRRYSICTGHHVSRAGRNAQHSERRSLRYRTLT